MRIIILIVLAIVAYILFKKFTTKKHSGKLALDDQTGANQLAADQSTVKQLVDGQSVSANSHSAPTIEKAAIATATAAGAAAELVLPSTGDRVADIQEMFKILNLRSSDAPRLGLTCEQYDSLKSGQITGLESDKLDTVMNRLSGMF